MKYIFLFFIAVVFATCSKPTTNPETKESHLGLLWSYFTEYSSAPSAEPIIENNHIYITGGPGMHKVDYTTGTRIWFSKYEGSASSLRNYGFTHNDALVVGMIPNTIIGFKKNDGEIKWQTSIPDTVDLYTIAVSQQFNNISYHSSSRSGYLFAVSMETGEVLWYHKFASNFVMRNILVFDNGDLLIPHEERFYEETYSYNAYMGRWRPSTKDWVWRYQLNGGGSFSVLYPQIENNIVYSGLTNAGFIAIDATTGQEIWKTIKTGLITGFHVLTPDTIFALARNRVYALDRHTGELLWETEPMGISESTRIHYKNGYVYWCHNNGIFIYDAKTGKQVHYQRHEFGGYIWTSTMAEDRLLVQTSSHLLAYELYNPEE